MAKDYEGSRLLSIARQSLVDAFAERVADIDNLGGRYGAFVTLREKGVLRGCIGYMSAIDTLHRQVYRLAREAAFHDWRFPPLEERELETVWIEVSVLSPMKSIASLDEFTLGRDGILMTLSGHRAVFLPEVALETGWDREDLLCALSRKAGLAPDAWKSSAAAFETFTSEAFHEM